MQNFDRRTVEPVLLPKSKERIRNKGRIEKLLRLIRFLREYRTIRECASHIGVHRKSIHRYLNLLTQLNFKVEVIPHYRHQYRIVNLDTYFRNGNDI